MQVQRYNALALIKCVESAPNGLCLRESSHALMNLRVNELDLH